MTLPARPAAENEWTERVDALVPNGLDRATKHPRAPVRTLVLSADRRTDDQARAYARALGRRARGVSPRDVGAAVERTRSERSVTIFALADALDESLLDSIWAGNRMRVGRGADPLPFGLMTAIAPEHLDWLVAKTLRWLDTGAALEQLCFADFDGTRNSGVVRVVDVAGRVSPPAQFDASAWTDPSTHVAAAFTHSVSFDAHLGEIALCGHVDGLEAFQREHRGAPRCYFDGLCFRLNGPEGAPTRILRAAHASPLVWFLNGCGTIPLGGSPFGVRTGYAYGLLAGAAIGVVGTHVTQPTTRSRNTIFGALLASGATTGEAALALSSLGDEADNFHAYPLLGAPDVRLTRGRPRGPSTLRETVARYEFGEDMPWACRLRLPGRGARRPVALVDDGGAGWSAASSHAIEIRGETELLVVSGEPREARGWLDIVLDDDADPPLAAHADELRRRLRVLRGYEFMQGETDEIDQCLSLVDALARTVAERGPVRRRRDAAFLLARIESALGKLQRSGCARFVTHVREHDFNMDRESYNGFMPGPVRRTRRACRACREALFQAEDRWLEEPTYVRTKLLCSNCFAVSMTLKSAPVRVSPLELARVSTPPGATLRLPLRAAGPSIRIWIAAAPRHGGPETAVGPMAVDLAAGRRTTRSLKFDLRTQAPGTQSIRAIVLAGGAAQFQNFVLPASMAGFGAASGTASG